MKAITPSNVVSVDDHRGPWRNVRVRCGACGREAISAQQAERGGDYRSFGLECGGPKGCGAMTMLVLGAVTVE